MSSGNKPQLSGHKRGRTESPPTVPPSLEINSERTSAAPSAAPSAKKARPLSLDEYIEMFENNNNTKPFQKYITNLKRNELPEPTPGGTSRVFIIKLNDKEYAMKRVNLSVFSESVYKEISSLLILNENECNCAPILESVVRKGEFIYLFMSYTKGKTLDNWLKTHPSEEDKLNRHNELKAALDKIHNFGIIHADIKPGNIWIPSDPAIPAYFIDFGSSIRKGEKASSFTVSPEGSPLESESASKVKNIAALDKLFLKKGGSHRHKRKKLNKTRRHRKGHN
jgi:serine/threonine protein kinase